MNRIFRLSVELRFVDWALQDMEFVVKEQIRTATVRPICTLQVGSAMDMDSIALVQQIFDDCLLSATGRTVGNQEQLTF